MADAMDFMKSGFEVHLLQLYIVTCMYILYLFTIFCVFMS